MDIFGSLRSAVKIDTVCIDNNVFRLHYKATMVFLMGFSLLVTGRQYFGDPIDCIQRDDIPSNVIDTYCWIHSTFTLPNASFKVIGEEVPAPGIDKWTPGEPRVFHKYYQWVCFMLFIQAAMFYFPRYLWKLSEGGRLKSLVLSLSNPVLSDDDQKDQLTLLVSYFKTNLKYHNAYFYYFVFCEFLNFVNVILQMYIVDAFLGGAFSTFGIDVLRFTEMNVDFRTDPMVQVFPRMTKCTFHRYGSSGDVQKHDALCILPLNIINEKIYVFLWFWFVGLAVLSGIIVAYRVVTIFFPHVRYMALRSRARLTDRYDLRTVLDMSKMGDWFVLYLLCKNIDPLHFRELMKQLNKEMADEGKGLLLPPERETAFNASAPKV